MDILFSVEILFILFNLFFLLKNLLKKQSIKKEGSYHSVNNFNSLFFATTILSIFLLIYVIFSNDEFTYLTKTLAIIIFLLLIASSFINTNILFGYYSFSYTYYSIKYSDIQKVTIINNSKTKLIVFLLKDNRQFSFKTSKNNGSIISEILNRKSVNTLLKNTN
ncbi:MAG: hypothetical protein ACRDAU_03575 [Clostridium sp.]